MGPDPIFIWNPKGDHAKLWNMDQKTLKKLNELKTKIETLFSMERIQEIQSSISHSLEETHEKVGTKIDTKVKKTLKSTMKLLNGAKSELEGIQEKIQKLMGVAPAKKSKPVRKSSPKKAKKKAAPPSKV